MRIALLTNAFPPDIRGGAGRIAGWHANILAAAGHEVIVEHPPTDWLNKPWYSRFFFHLSDAWPRSESAKRLLQAKPDLLLTENLTGCGFGTPIVVAKSLGIPWVHVLHDVQLFEPSGRLRHLDSYTLWQKAWSWYRKRFFGEPTLVITPTQWLLNQHRFREWFLDTSFELLPNPAPEETFVLRSPQTPLNVLLVGATKEKGFDMAEWIASQRADIHVSVTHPAQQQSFPPVQHVELKSNSGPQDVLELMKEADVLIVPSTIAENQPTVIYEAASMGLPVIASDIGGIRETLGGAGYLCQPLDGEAWLKALDELKDPAIYSKQATMMYELARSRSFGEYSIAFTEILESLVSDQNDRR